MTDLLDVLNFDYAARGPRGVPPKMMEFPVAADAAPYLVSSTRSVVWAKRASRTRTVKAAVRSVQGFYKEAVEELAQAAMVHKWGSIHPLTTEGLKACVSYLAFYGLAEYEVISHPDFEYPDTVSADWIDNNPRHDADWMLPGCVVIIPKDRALFGFMGTVGTSRVCAVIHNATRGFTMAGEMVPSPKPEPEPAPSQAAGAV